MKDNQARVEERRRFLKIVGGGTVLLPLAALTACGGEETPAARDAAPTTSADPKPAPASSPAPAETAKDAAAGGTGMPKLDEKDPQAESLAYRHDATTVDPAKNPRYKSGQLCSNCILYQGKDGEQWGGCSIFPGRLVNADGWCNVYAPKST